MMLGSVKGDRYAVWIQKRDANGMLLDEQRHDCLNMAEVFDFTEVCNRCGWSIRDILEIKN